MMNTKEQEGLKSLDKEKYILEFDDTSDIFYIKGCTMSVSDLFEDLCGERSYDLDVYQSYLNYNYSEFRQAKALYEGLPAGALRTSYEEDAYYYLSDYYWQSVAHGASLIAAEFADIGIKLVLGDDIALETYDADAIVKLKTELEDKVWLAPLQDERLEAVCTHLDLSKGSFCRMMRGNLQTNGRASRRILGEAGLLCAVYEAMDGHELDDIEEMEELGELVHAVSVAEHRHRDTDYDLIDKKGMSREAVDSLRRSYNRL